MDSLPTDMVVRRIDGVTVVRLKISNVSSAVDVTRLTASINELIDSGDTRLVLDLKHVRYTGSATLGMLLELRQKMDKKGGHLVLSHAEPIEELLRISKTARLFRIAPDPKAGVAMIRPTNR